MATTATVERPVEKLQDAEVRIVRNIRSALRQGAGEADPATAAPLNLIRLAEIAFCQEFPVAKADNRLVNAVARGITVRRKLMEAEGGSLSAEEAARSLGISKTAILKRYHKGRIIAWRDERQNAARFPVWQFKDHKVLEGLEEVLQILNAGSRLDDFGRMLFFLSHLGFLGKKRPVDCLRAGKVHKVLQAAEGYGG
ncbi:MAG: hypothetical protein ABSG78_19820 [Verrucomicrobiota bacterium]